MSTRYNGVKLSNRDHQGTILQLCYLNAVVCSIFALSDVRQKINVFDQTYSTLFGKVLQGKVCDMEWLWSALQDGVVDKEVRFKRYQANDPIEVIHRLGDPTSNVPLIATLDSSLMRRTSIECRQY